VEITVFIISYKRTAHQMMGCSFI